jgi:hypothetical protein
MPAEAIDGAGDRRMGMVMHASRGTDVHGDASQHASMKSDVEESIARVSREGLRRERRRNEVGGRV